MVRLATDPCPFTSSLPRKGTETLSVMISTVLSDARRRSTPERSMVLADARVSPIPSATRRLYAPRRNMRCAASTAPPTISTQAIATSGVAGASPAATSTRVDSRGAA